MKNIPFADFQDIEICFILELHYYNVIYRYSSFPVDIENSNGEILQFDGQMSDPNITQQTKIAGFDIESDTVSLELVLPFDPVEEFFKGRILDNSLCVISMVTVRNGKVIQPYEDIVGLFRGSIIQPVIGDPTQVTGYVTFSIENNINVKEIYLIDETARITTGSYEFLHVDSAEGALAPFVFGAPYYYPRPNNTNNFISYSSSKVSPAYEVRRKFSGPPAGARYNEVLILIANHEVKATHVHVHDNINNQAYLPVASEINVYGETVSLVNIDGAGLNHSKTLGAQQPINYWIRWGDYGPGSTVQTGNGHPNTFGFGTLEGAGDLCRFVLDKTELTIDWTAWDGIAPLLNTYKFAGYVNEKILALEWLETNIIEHLPIEIINGPKGLTPIVSLYHYSNDLREIAHVVDNSDFEIITPIASITEPTEIVNKPIVKFAWSGDVERYKTTMMIDPSDFNGAQSFRDPYSDLSFNRYGLHEKTYELNYVYDLDTAVKILRDKVRLYGLGVHLVEVSADKRFGYINLGDVLTLESERLHITNHVCQVVRKSWTRGRWSFMLQIEDNLFINNRN